MARRMSEEFVTKSLIRWLMSSGWIIVCYDYPQSGIGKHLHPINTVSKTEGIIIPDIVAIKGTLVVHFENKNRFFLEDFNKVSYLKNTSDYDEAYSELLDGYKFTSIYYGVGMPYSPKNYSRSLSVAEKVDFMVFLKEDNSVQIVDNTGCLF